MLGKTSGTKVKRSLFLFILASLAILPTQIILTDAFTPGGIADLELAGSLSSAREILTHWGADNRRVVIASLVLDFPFLIAYTLLFFYLTRLVTEKVNVSSKLLRRTGRAIGAGFILAGLSDILENMALFAVVFHTEDNAWAVLAYYCAAIKFLMLGLGGIYLAFAGAWATVNHFSAGNSSKS